MHAKTCLLNFRVKARGTDPSLPNSDECVQAPFISLSASGLFAVWRILKCDSRADKADDNHAGCPAQCYTARHSWNSLKVMEILGSFNDIVLLSLQYQGFPTQQPVQQHTEGPTYEVGDEPCSTHSEQQHHLPTFQLTAGEHPFLFLLSFFFFFHFSLLGLWSPSLSCDGKSCVSGKHSESAERCMPASPRGTTHSLTSSACESTHRHALRHVPIARTHGKFGLVLRCHCAWLCWWWNGRPFIAGLSEWKKKKKEKAPEAALSDPPWLSDLETSQAELWILSSQIWFAVILSFFFLFLFIFLYDVFLTASKWTARRLDGWEFTLRCISSSSVTLSSLVVVWNHQTQFPPAPPKKYTFIIYTDLQQSKANCSRKTLGGVIFNIKQRHRLSK